MVTEFCNGKINAEYATLWYLEKLSQQLYRSLSKYVVMHRIFISYKRVDKDKVFKIIVRTIQSIAQKLFS